MPFYFASPYAPAEIWRNLETYNPTPYEDGQAAGPIAYFNIVNYVGRGILISIQNRVNIGRNYRMSVDGGAFIGPFQLTADDSITVLVGFTTSIQVQHQRTGATGADSICWVLQE